MNSSATDNSPPLEQRSTARFQHRLVTCDVADGVAVLHIRRERARHSLNPATIFQLTAAIRTAQRHPSVRGIVITGTGTAFSYGADLTFFIAAIEQRRMDRVLEFTQAGNDCYRAIESCSKPVVAALNGSALGGGAELALACGQRIAARSASLGFPEANLGLFPGWGGVWRLQRLLSEGHAKWLLYSGQAVSAGDAHAFGLIDCVSTPPQLLADAKSMALRSPPDSTTPKKSHRLNAASLAAFHALHSVTDLFADRFAADAPTDIRAHVAQIKNMGRATLQRVEQLFRYVKGSTWHEFSAENHRLVAQAFGTAEVYRRLKAAQAALPALRTGPRRTPSSSLAPHEG